MTSALIVDAGPLYAYVDAHDAHHAECLGLLTFHAGPLIVPTLVVTEVAHLIGARLGAEPEVRFVGDLASGAFHAEPVHPADRLGVATLVARHADFPLGTVHASVTAAAERSGIDTVATLDHRHFRTVRPSHVEAFAILP